MKVRLTIALVALAALIGSWQLATTQLSAQQKFTLAMILTGLQTKGNTPQTNTLAKRNIYITEKVKQNGVTFRLTAEIESELRNAGATTVLIETIRRYGPSPTPTPYQTPAPTKPYATFKKVWVDYDVTEGGVKGMRIHVGFTAYKMRQLASYIAIYFKDENGNLLRDRNGKFTSSTKDVAAYFELTPCCDATDYDDAAIFMPYDELELEKGKYSLKMDIKLIYKAGGIISNLTEREFEYSNGKQKDYDPDTADATVRKVWIDYNVSQSGQKGMRVHINCQVTGLKGIDSKLAVRIADAESNFISSKTSAYANASDQFVANFDMKPGYEPTDYKDAQIFIPYDEIDVGRGKWKLKLDIDLNDGDDELIKHLQWYEFDFERK